MHEPGPEFFGSFEKQLRTANDFVRVAPQQKFEGTEDDQMSGILHVLSQKIIEQLWREVCSSTEAANGIIVLLSDAEPLLSQEIASMSLEQACCRLSKLMSSVLSKEVMKSIQKMDQFQIQDMEQFSAYVSYKSVLALGASSIGSSGPIHHMITGFKTGVVESWRMILESCRAHEYQYSERINRSSLEEIARNSNPLLLKLASTHMRIFAIYSTNVNGSNDFDLGMDPDPSLFHIEGLSPERRLGLSPKLMAKIKHGYFGTDEKRYSGCPALYAQGVRRPNVIEDLYQEMVIPAALHFLEPAMKRYGS